jgi:hypothetical protein
VRYFICKGIALGALLLVAALIPARANIGDTMTELRQRYGSAKDMGGQMLFEVRLKDGQILPARGATDVENHFTITVYFDGDHSAMEVFTRNTSDPAKADMTPEDINTILNAVGGGIPWQPIEVPSGKQTWVWGDKKGAQPQLMARFDPNKTGNADDASVLVIMEYTQK